MVIDTSALVSMLTDEPEPLLVKGGDFVHTDIGVVDTTSLGSCWLFGVALVELERPITR